MYIRFIQGEVREYRGRDGYPAELVLIWAMNETCQMLGEEIIYGKPIKIENITLSDAKRSHGDVLFPVISDGNWLSPGDVYGAFEFYAEGAIVIVETDHVYTYVVANSERAQAAMRQAAAMLDFPITE